jgi:hypothetical protein
LPRASAGHENHFRNARCYGFLDRILNKRLIDDRQHFLRTRLGSRQETSAKPGNRKYGFGDFQHRALPQNAFKLMHERPFMQCSNSNGTANLRPLNSFNTTSVTAQKPILKSLNICCGANR